MIYRLIAPKWLDIEPKVLEGEFTNEQVKVANEIGYNIYYLPNYPSSYDQSVTVRGNQIDTFEYAFVDYDTKTKRYSGKQAFIENVASSGIVPSSIVDSGHGIHIYWRILNLDVMSYLRLQRRLMRLFKTDEAVGQIFQLMRVPGTLNTKDKENVLPCVRLYEDDVQYTAEELDALLPPILPDDETYCRQHYNKTYELNQDETSIPIEVPAKFQALLDTSAEVNRLCNEQTSDRSRRDYRLGCLMHKAGFTRIEAASVLMNGSKARSRAPVHRQSYALSIVNKIWDVEESLIHYGT